MIRADLERPDLERLGSDAPLVGLNNRSRRAASKRRWPRRRAGPPLGVKHLRLIACPSSKPRTRISASFRKKPLRVRRAAIEAHHPERPNPRLCPVHGGEGPGGTESLERDSRWCRERRKDPVIESAFPATLRIPLKAISHRNVNAVDAGMVRESRVSRIGGTKFVAFGIREH